VLEQVRACDANKPFLIINFVTCGLFYLISGELHKDCIKIYVLFKRKVCYTRYARLYNHIKDT